MALFEFDADSAEVSATGATKVGSTYVLDKTTGNAYVEDTSPTAIATSELTVNYPIEGSFDSNLSVTGNAIYSWLSDGNGPQRVVYTPEASGTFNGIRISNGQSDGGFTDSGIKDVKIYISSDPADVNTVYGQAVNGTLLFDSVIAEHVASDVADWQELTLLASEFSGLYIVIDIATNYGNTSYMGFRGFEILQYNAPAQILIDTIDYGAFFAGDHSTVTESLTGTVTATYQSTDDEPPTNFEPGTPETLAELHNRENTGLQTESIKVFLDGLAGSVWSGNSITTYSPDVTPPVDPTGTKQVEGDRWGMWWDQSPEGPTIISRLRRVVDGVPAYLANVAGLAEWVATTPTSWWTFSRGLATADSQSNSWEEADIVATSVAYSTQHVDLVLNNSQWVNFTEQVPELDYPSEDDVRYLTTYDHGTYTGNLVLPTPAEIKLDVPSDSSGSVLGTYDPTETPESPTLVSVTPNDGSFTATFTTPSPTNSVYLQYVAVNEAGWVTDSQTVVGSGSITVPATNKSTYYVVAIINDGGCDSKDSNMLPVTPRSPLCPSTGDENWPRWVFASICKHFNDCKGDFYLFIEGQYRNSTVPDDYLELRVDGPYITEINKNYFNLYLEVNILVQSKMNDTDYHRIHTDVGKVSATFTGIDLYKLGTGPNDTQEHFGCLKLLHDTQSRSRTQINHFGQIDPKTRLMQASVEGHYTVDLKGE